MTDPIPTLAELNEIERDASFIIVCRTGPPRCVSWTCRTRRNVPRLTDAVRALLAERAAWTTERERMREALVSAAQSFDEAAMVFGSQNYNIRAAWAQSAAERARAALAGEKT